MPSPLEAKDLVRQGVDIVELIGASVQLRRQGRHFVGLCPWHDDTRPSLQVNPDRQTFRCWVCDIGGDVFTFVMRTEGVEFREALEMLAERAGVALEPDRRAAGAPDSATEKRVLLRTMAWAESVYHSMLADDPAGAPARRYLAGRGISDQSIRLFRIGYAPDQWDWLLKRARRDTIELPTLERVGLVVRRQDAAGHYDRFRGRVMFPIRDVQSRPVAFGGRILPENAHREPAKYINSPETTLFSKSKHVYGLDKAKEACVKERILVVVEGYTDCVVAHQSGLRNVVALLGTALTERHVHLLRRYADRVILTLDGDEAGQKRAGEILELFVAMQMDLRILTLPEKLDPCDFLRAHGGEAFVGQLADAQDALEHKFRMVTQGLDPAAGTHQANAALEQILAILAKAPRLASTTVGSARLRQEQMLARLARWFLVPEDQIRRRIRELRRASGTAIRRVSVAVDEPTPPPGANLWDRELVELVLSHPEWSPQIFEKVAPDELASQRCRWIYQCCRELAGRGITPDVNRVLRESEDPAITTLLVDIDEQVQAKQESDHRLRLEQTLSSFRRRKEDAHNRKTIAALRAAGDGSEENDTLDALFATLKTRHRKSDPTDG